VTVISHLDGSCKIGKCNLTSGNCTLQAKPMDTLCRPKSATNLCDVPEFCNGYTYECPSDLAYDMGYSMKCATQQFVCGVPKSQFTSKLNGRGEQVWSIGNCTIGAGTSFTDLLWPDCTTGVGSCIVDGKCPNNRGLSNYAVTKCNPTTGTWSCLTKTDVGTEAKQFAFCNE
jgi:hypothetical protein